jgi:glutamate-ammonia-ligase adenylyltransferase
VAWRVSAFDSYYAQEAESWELLALCRARVVWASSANFAHLASTAIEGVLRRPRDASACARDVLDMRALMAAERPPQGFWDLKLGEGGLVDMEFCAQHLQLIHAAEGGPVRQNNSNTLEPLGAAHPKHETLLRKMLRTCRLHQQLSLKIALDEGDAGGERWRPRPYWPAAGAHLLDPEVPPGDVASRHVRGLQLVKP